MGIASSLTGDGICYILVNVLFRVGFYVCMFGLWELYLKEENREEKKCERDQTWASKRFLSPRGSWEYKWIKF